MAKSFVRISLATKFRVLFAVAGLAIIVAALALPWYFTERLTEAAVERSAGEIARLVLHEWEQNRQVAPLAQSDIARYFTAGADGRYGLGFVLLLSGNEDVEMMDAPVRQAVSLFGSEPQRKMVLLTESDEEGRKVYRYIHAVRAKASYLPGRDGRDSPEFQPGQMIGVIDITMPPPVGAMVWWTRGMFVLGAILAVMTALITLHFITRQVVLEPVRRLDELADKVAEGDLTGRCDLVGGDEFQKLSQRFNEMLDVINAQQDQLRQANRALDLRLSELAEANVALYEAGRIKNEFLANVSHELRTPLNSIIGFAELLAETDDEKRRRHAGNILTSARLLAGIVNDLLTAAKIEAGTGEMRREKVSITDLSETLGQLVRPMADKKHLRLEVKPADDVPVVTTDPGKVQQILYNLLSNAIKFTPPDGGVTISVRCVSATVSPLRVDSVAIAVADTGPGIPVADQKRIFEKFSRLDNTMTREHGGAGLGLAISKTLTGLLSGRLTL
ncbi:MAG: HAMP domain-containing histidine kinase, partial [Phycisphaerae bacterium]|nr:HAMP domain-containing histidine kinase [Phycisphaerae bacterium]